MRPASTLAESGIDGPAGTHGAGPLRVTDDFLLMRRVPRNDPACMFIQRCPATTPHAHAAVGYLLLGGLMGRAACCAEAMSACSRLLWAPRQYTWPQLWQRENTW